jgi:hypothetical protein
LIPRERSRPESSRLEPRSCFFVVSRPEVTAGPEDAGAETVRASLTLLTAGRSSRCGRLADPRLRRVRWPCSRCERTGRP